MEQLPRLQARLENLRELRDLFRALRAMAASHVQQAQGALSGIRQYVGVVEAAIAEGAALLPALDGGLAPATDGSALVVVCSEHGFVGGFNERLLERAKEVRLAGQELAVIGQRGASLAAESGLDVARSFPMATHVGGVVAITRRVADYLVSVSSASIVYGGYRRGGRFEVETRRILPLDPELLMRSERSGPPLHHLSAETLLQRLAHEYLFAEITRAVMESLASENAARLGVMEMADQNIGDKLEELSRTEQALRQEAITSELLDVVIGSEAILGR